MSQQMWQRHIRGLCRINRAIVRFWDINTTCASLFVNWEKNASMEKSLSFALMFEAKTFHANCANFVTLSKSALNVPFFPWRKISLQVRQSRNVKNLERRWLSSHLRMLSPAKNLSVQP